MPTPALAQNDQMDHGVRMSDNTDKAQQKASLPRAKPHDQSVTAKFAPIVALGDKIDIKFSIVVSFEGTFKTQV